uniref:Uncharacterized protein n=1 Tax=Physcomitrium patens TaxID=3218 RepID=A0A7I3Z2R3_PHYPA
MVRSRSVVERTRMRKCRLGGKAWEVWRSGRGCCGAMDRGGRHSRCEVDGQGIEKRCMWDRECSECATEAAEEALRRWSGGGWMQGEANVVYRGGSGGFGGVEVFVILWVTGG